jgi:hypothetical protein
MLICMEISHKQLYPFIFPLDNFQRILHSWQFVGNGLFDHVNGFLLASLYSKYLVLVLPRAAYLPLRHKLCHPNGITCLHWVPVLLIGTVVRIHWHQLDAVQQ